MTMIARCTAAAWCCLFLAYESWAGPRRDDPSAPLRGERQESPAAQSAHGEECPQWRHHGPRRRNADPFPIVVPSFDWYGPYGGDAPLWESRSRAGYHVLTRPDLPLENALPAADGSTPVVPVGPRAVAFQLQAERAYRVRDYASAERAAHHALIEEPENGRLYLFAAQTAVAQGDFVQGAAALESAAQLLPPEELGFVVDRRLQLGEPGDWESQWQALDRHLAQRPHDPSARLVRAHDLACRGQRAAARADLQAAAESGVDSRLLQQLQSWVEEPLPEPPSTKPSGSAPTSAPTRR